MSGSEEPLRHVQRINPPWDDLVRTVCGRSPNDVKVIVPYTEAVAFAKKHGLQRMAFVFCMACIDRVRYGTPKWEKDPGEVVERWIGRRHNHGERERLERQLNALAVLVARHHEEYETLLAPNVPTLAAHRRERAQR